MTNQEWQWIQTTKDVDALQKRHDQLALGQGKWGEAFHYWERIYMLTHSKSRPGRPKEAEVFRYLKRTKVRAEKRGIPFRVEMRSHNIFEDLKLTQYVSPFFDCQGRIISHGDIIYWDYLTALGTSLGVAHDYGIVFCLDQVFYDLEIYRIRFKTPQTLVKENMKAGSFQTDLLQKKDFSMIEIKGNVGENLDFLLNLRESMKHDNWDPKDSEEDFIIALVNLLAGT